MNADRRLSARIIGTYPSADSVWETAVSGNYAYLANGDAGGQVVDISDPFAQRRTGADYDTTGVATGVAIVGS